MTPKKPFEIYFNLAIRKGFRTYNVFPSLLNQMTNKTFEIHEVVCDQVYKHYIDQEIESSPIVEENLDYLLKYYTEVEEYEKCFKIFKKQKEYGFC